LTGILAGIRPPIGPFVVSGVSADRVGGHADRVGDHREPGAVLEDRLDLHLGDDLGDARQHVRGAEHAAPGLDRVGEPRPVPGRLAHGVGDQRDRFGDVQPQPAGPAGARELGGGEDQQPVPLGR
jgi:hypothetical protein